MLYFLMLISTLSLGPPHFLPHPSKYPRVLGWFIAFPGPLELLTGVLFLAGNPKNCNPGAFSWEVRLQERIEFPPVTTWFAELG